MHFGEIKQPKTLLISRNEQLYILKEVENQYVCHDLSDEISDKNSPLLSQKVFLRSIIYPSEKTIHWNKQHFGMRYRPPPHPPFSYTM